MVVDLAALEVLVTAGNVDLAAIEIINTAIQAAIEAVETDIGFIRKETVITPTTGTGTAIATLAPGAAFHFSGLRLHLGSALAAAETLTVTVNDGSGAAYDVVLYSQDLGTPDIRDVVLECVGEAYDFAATDEIMIIFPLPCFFMIGTTAFEHRKELFRLTSIVRSHMLSSNSSIL